MEMQYIASVKTESVTNLSKRLAYLWDQPPTFIRVVENQDEVALLRLDDTDITQCSISAIAEYFLEFGLKERLCLVVGYLDCHHVGCKAWRHEATATIREPLIQRGNYIATQLVVD